ncbi:MAG: hypothetical protein H7833_20050 [Magnetococcus sp. DMHC-1]|nr:hypothetical protein [Magnetococcales bacterium]
MNTSMGTLERYFAAVGLAEEGLPEDALAFLGQKNASSSSTEYEQGIDQIVSSPEIAMPEMASGDEPRMKPVSAPTW